MIEIDRVSQVFRTSSRQEHLALSQISLTTGWRLRLPLSARRLRKIDAANIVGWFVRPTGRRRQEKGKAIMGRDPIAGRGFRSFAAVSLEDRARQSC